MQQVIHYFIHLIFPGVIAYFLFKRSWKRAYIIMLLTMLVDLDHLLAKPIFDPCRCSIGFHMLHSYVAIVFYTVLLIYPKSRIVAIGLLTHMSADTLDCLFIKNNC